MKSIELSLYAQWLQERVAQHNLELLAACSNDKHEMATIKRKFGQLEAFQVALEAFRELVKDHEVFRKERLDESDTDAVEPASSG